MRNSSLIKNHSFLDNPFISIQDLNTNFHLKPKNRKAKIWYRRKCDVGASKNAGQAFSTKRLSSHCIIYEISAFLLFGSRRKLVICVGKRRGFSRRFWLLIKELLIARDADRRNKTPYINVSFLEFDFLESHIFLEMFILTNKNHRLLDNPLFFPQTKILIPY